jgi:acylphosphatase
MPARRLTITGRVQGVFFRVSARAKAEELGLRGWARNTPDGTVQVHAEGPEEVLDLLEAWCRQGPDKAKVETVTAAAVPEEGYPSFEIRG